MQSNCSQHRNNGRIPGLCERPLAFDEIKHYVETNQLDQLGRLPADLKVVIIHKQTTLWIVLTDVMTYL